MITTADVRDYLKDLSPARHFYCGKLDNKPEKALGVYTLRRSEPPLRMIGALPTFEITGVSVLLHWNQNAAETEQAARALYDQLYSAKNVVISNHTVYMIELLVPEPVDVGTDEKGVYERVIELNIYYERKDTSCP